MSAHLSLRLFQRHLRSLGWGGGGGGGGGGFGSGIGIGFTLLLTRSSPSRHPPFTQYPSPSRTLVRDGQTSPHKPRLVVPHSTCPSLSSSPPAHSFIIGPAVINTHTMRWFKRAAFYMGLKSKVASWRQKHRHYGSTSISKAVV